MKTKKRSVIVLCIALVLILAGSILAGKYNSSNGSVTVSRISFGLGTVVSNSQDHILS